MDDPALHATDRAGTDASVLTLGVTAALVGEYRFIESTLYSTLGSWVVDMPIPAVQLQVDAQSMRHAWHAELWAERLPVLAGVDAERLSVPSRPTQALFAALEGDELPGGEGPPGALPRLAAMYRVILPRLVTTYVRHLRVASPITDGPVLRALRLVLHDETEDWHAGERLVQRLVTRPHDVEAVYQFQQHLESLVVAAGARQGLVAFPDTVPLD
ncbi:MAG: hypothetical protein WB565_13560 [Acidimicrobiales bacterium]